MQTYKTPGVYREDVFQQPVQGLRTGVPAFLGYVAQVPAGSASAPPELTRWPQFQELFGPLLAGSYLGYAVRGFFENGGSHCYVVPLDAALPAEEALQAGLASLEPLNDLDLICAPDLLRPDADGAEPDEAALLRMQAALLKHCDRQGDRFAILDSPRAAAADATPALRSGASVAGWPGRLRRQGNRGINGALYFPWVRILEGPESSAGFVPPCGHVAGVYARSDGQAGVHKAPANEILEGVLDLAFAVSNAEQDRLNPAGVNCLRAFPGRGIRVWGARTLAASADAEWTYVSVRRLFLTAGRWIERNMAGAAFEPNVARLWASITRDLNAYFNGLFQQGALKGASAAEAFYVKCDAETNPPEVRDAGMLVTEIGLAPALPAEFVVVRIIHGVSGVTISDSASPPATRPPADIDLGGLLAPAEVRIRYIEYNPPGADLAGEYVLIQNRGGQPADLSNWTLRDRAGHVFVFPPFVLQPASQVRVWVKRGANTDADLFWGQPRPVWNNVGDQATLADASGQVVDVYPPRLDQPARAGKQLLNEF